jgi:uncharacterized membrane protein (DUF485 family)
MMQVRSFADTRSAEAEGVATTDRRRDAAMLHDCLLRGRRRYVWPLLSLALLGYFGSLCTIVTLPDAMTRPVFGGLTVGVLMILFQWVLTVAVVCAYCAWARRRSDVDAAELLMVLSQIVEHGHA